MIEGDSDMLTEQAGDTGTGVPADLMHRSCDGQKSAFRRHFVRRSARSTARYVSDALPQISTNALLSPDGDRWTSATR